MHHLVEAFSLLELQLQAKRIDIVNIFSKETTTTLSTNSWKECHGDSFTAFSILLFQDYMHSSSLVTSGHPIVLHRDLQVQEEYTLTDGKSCQVYFFIMNVISRQCFLQCQILKFHCSANYLQY